MKLDQQGLNSVRNRKPLGNFGDEHCKTLPLTKQQSKLAQMIMHMPCIPKTPASNLGHAISCPSLFVAFSVL
jgi:hypothetical protein